MKLCSVRGIKLCSQLSQVGLAEQMVSSLAASVQLAAKLHVKGAAPPFAQPRFAW